MLKGPSHRFWLMVLCSLFCIPDGAAAQPASDSFDSLRAAVRLGDTLVVTDDRGGQIRGRLLDMSSTTIELTDAGTKRQFQPSAVRRIARVDSIVNGMLLGLAAGGAGGLLAAKAECSQGRGYSYWACFTPEDYGTGPLAFLILLPAVGLGIGAWADSARNLTVFDRGALAVRPLVSHGRAGVMVEIAVYRPKRL